jgi:Transglycosylase SLT domain
VHRFIITIALRRGKIPRATPSACIDDSAGRICRRYIAGFSPHLCPVVELAKPPIVTIRPAEIVFMKSFPKFALAVLATLAVSPDALAQGRAQYESMVANHARANNVPEALVHRVIVRESKYHAGLVGRGGTIGLMQIKLPTARGLGYTGDAAGLRDPDTNLSWGVKYLAGAYRAANGDHNRAVRYYASGYYHAAKRQRQNKPLEIAPVLASSSAPKIVAAPASKPADANALQTTK